ncbi:MAG: alpha/beta fold hydrolase [Acidobacteriota bacterium]
MINKCYLHIIKPVWLGMIVWLALSQSVQAQELYQPDLADVKARVAEVLRFYQVADKATPQDIDELVQLEMKIETPSVTMRDRAQAYLEVYRLLYRLNGVTSPPSELMNNNLRISTGIIGTFLTSGPVKPLGQTTTPWGQLGQVEKRGRGATPMILIAPVGFDWTIYQTFMERNADRYTMYGVTLPGSGNTPLPTNPKYFDPMSTPWWESARQGILTLIEKQKLNKPVIVGLQSGAYLAARLALDQPDKVRAAVMLCGLAHTPQPSETDPDRPMTLAERRQSATLRVAAMVTDLWPRVTLASREGGEKLLQTFSRFYPPGLSHHQNRNNELFLMSALDSSLYAWRYFHELALTDLATELGKLTVPVLAITADHDDASTMQGTPDTTQWTEVKLRYPSIPLTISRFENSRLFVTDDAPEDLDAAINAFLTGKPIEIKRERSLAVRPSPRASTVQQIGLAEVVIAYGRPQVKGREIWGKLIPWNRVWRTGANEATTITFSRDVLVEGQKLLAGTYSLFTIPSDGEWTLIFNRITHQWGAFYYNPEFDVLRVKTKPQNSEPMEWLNFGFEQTGERSANLILHWEKLKLLVKIEDTI